MKEADFEGSQPGLNLNDILLVIFKHKWKILICSAVGLVAAALSFFFGNRFINRKRGSWFGMLSIAAASTRSIQSVAQLPLRVTTIHYQLRDRDPHELGPGDGGSQEVGKEDATIPDAAKGQAPA
jgi:hypothetical protein